MISTVNTIEVQHHRKTLSYLISQHVVSGCCVFVAKPGTVFLQAHRESQIATKNYAVVTIPTMVIFYRLALTNITEEVNTLQVHETN